MVVRYNDNCVPSKYFSFRHPHKFISVRESLRSWIFQSLVLTCLIERMNENLKLERNFSTFFLFTSWSAKAGRAPRPHWMNSPFVLIPMSHAWLILWIQLDDPLRQKVQLIVTPQILTFFCATRFEGKMIRRKKIDFFGRQQADFHLLIIIAYKTGRRRGNR